MADNTRTLQFNSDGLEKDVTLLLMFTPPAVGEAYKDVFPICWRVIKLKRSGRCVSKVKYTTNTAFVVFPAESDSGSSFPSSTFVLCGAGQKCSVLYEGGVMTGPTPGEAGYLTCTNESVAATDISVGLSDDSGDRVDAILVWGKVAINSKVRAQFTPTMEIYATNDYQEDQIIRGAVESPLLWKKDLQTLQKEITMNVSIDAASGEIRVTEA